MSTADQPSRFGIPRQTAPNLRPPDLARLSGGSRLNPLRAADLGLAESAEANGLSRYRNSQLELAGHAGTSTESEDGRNRTF